MEKTQSQVKRSRGQASKSSHVIDLRQSAEAGPAEPATPPSTPPPLKQEVEPEAATQPPASAPVRSPAPVPAAPATLSPVRHRFWPAFWRFIVLLIVFAILVVGGVYLYIHYYNT